MKRIQKIKLHNFKKFEELEIAFDDSLNLIIGDNEAGKSSILTAIDLVLSGSKSKIESFGLENLFCLNAITNFFASDRNYAKLPRLIIELYLNEQHNPDVNGRINSDNQDCDGLRLICEPNDELSKDIREIIGQAEANFPFEFYLVSFKTFAGETYTGYKKYLRHILIDNSQINSEYATREYIKDIYNSKVKNNIERFTHQNEYRKHKYVFKSNVLSEFNSRLENYSFGLRTNAKSNLENDLIILEDSISIENKGKGRQCFIKTEFALKKGDGNLDVVLIEEPENHLSHTNMKKLIRKINDSNDKQLFIATHSNLISTRLDLRKSILLNSNDTKPLKLKDLPEETSKFFIKAPDNNILEFILSKKVILVEGDAEYILMEPFYNNTIGARLDESGIHVISVDGTSFKRYLDIAKLLKIKTAVIRDNDGDYQANCIDNYGDYIQDNIKIFFDDSNLRSTFEISVYCDNKDVCDELFGAGRRGISVQDYMLKNKAEAAFKLLDKKAEMIITPKYIMNAIEWISA